MFVFDKIMFELLSPVEQNLAFRARGIQDRPCSRAWVLGSNWDWRHTDHRTVDISETNAAHTSQLCPKELMKYFVDTLMRNLFVGNSLDGSKITNRLTLPYFTCLPSLPLIFLLPFSYLLFSPPSLTYHPHTLFLHLFLTSSPSSPPPPLRSGWGRDSVTCPFLSS